MFQPARRQRWWTYSDLPAERKHLNCKWSQQPEWLKASGRRDYLSTCCVCCCLQRRRAGFYCIHPTGSSQKHSAGSLSHLHPFNAGIKMHVALLLLSVMIEKKKRSTWTTAGEPEPTDDCTPQSTFWGRGQTRLKSWQDSEVGELTTHNKV